MRTLTLKNVPDHLYAELKRAASAHRRSLNSEVIAAIERSVEPHKVSVADALELARRLRQKTSRWPATTKQLARARAAGRP